MLIFRIFCAVMMAWAVSISLARPEAAELLQILPEMQMLGPVAGAAVGYFNLATRQGWGFIVAFANGIWAGVLSVIASGVLYVLVKIIQAIRTNLISTFDNFLNVFSTTVQPLLDEVVNIPLLVVSLGAAAIVGVITEVIHWLLVRVRQRKSSRPNSP